jgi:hypothetical protein
MKTKNRKKEMVLKDETPRSGDIKLAAGEKRGSGQSTDGSNEGHGLKPKGGPCADTNGEEKLRLSFAEIRKIGTWNVRSMYEGKLEIVKKEMGRVGVELLGVSELRWTGKGYFQSGDYKMYYSGHETERKNGVAVICGNDMARTVLGYNPVNDRIMTIRLQGKPVNMTIVQVYAPTANDTEEEHDKFYSVLQETMDGIHKGDALIAMGDLNAKVGDEGGSSVVGGYGLGTRNEAGLRLIEFCESNGLRIANTWFKQPKRRIYTWTSPGGNYRNQIDFIMVKNRWASAVKSANTLPGADCGSDHELLVAKISVRLKKKTAVCTPIRYDVQQIPTAYRVEVRNRFSLLELEDREPEELWQEAKEVVMEVADKHIPKRAKKKRSPWLSKEAIGIAENRRLLRKSERKGEEVRRLNAEFQAQVRRDKEEYYKEVCRQMEQDSRKGRTRDLFKKIKQLTGKYVARVGVYKNKGNKNETEERECKERWREYTEELYRKDENMKEDFEAEEYEREPDILESEVRKAMREVSNQKAPGVDGIPIELWKEGEEEGVQVLKALCQSIWRTGVWPKDWKTSIYVPIYKKGDATDCSNYRTIALIAHASKVMLKIIMGRMESYVEKEIPEVQAGYRKGRGTRDHIANLRWTMERAREYNQDIFLCFIDYSKAFDSVDHSRMWNTLKDMGFPIHLVVLLKSLYENQVARVRTDFGDTDSFGIGKGVRQGCILSPCLFNLYAERIMREAGLEEVEEGIHIGGKVVNNLRFADDSTLAATKEEDLRSLLRSTKKASEKAGLYLNIKKTKVMTTTNVRSFKVDGEDIEVVKNFVFLGSNIQENGECRGEILRRLALGRAAMCGLNRIWKDKEVTKGTKAKLIQTLVFPIVAYGSESWVIRESERCRIDAFENWCWRRMLRVPWTAKRTNESIRRELGIENNLTDRLCKQKLTYFGHVMRGNGLEKTIVMGMGEGARGRGRPRTRWMDEIRSLMGMTIQELKEAVWDRKQWRRKVMDVTRGRVRPDGTR